MSLDELTPSQRAAWDRGQADAFAAVADVETRTTISVALGNSQIGWCLLHQAPVLRCPCDDIAPEYLVEDIDTALADVIAECRSQLAQFAAAADAIGATA